jgi:hypothetical protein
LYLIYFIKFSPYLKQLKSTVDKQGLISQMTVSVGNISLSNKQKPSNAMSPVPDKKSSACSHQAKQSVQQPTKHVFKSKKQLRDEEIRDNLLRAKIKCKR